MGASVTHVMLEDREKEGVFQKEERSKLTSLSPSQNDTNRKRGQKAVGVVSPFRFSFFQSGPLQGEEWREERIEEERRRGEQGMRGEEERG
jgi:hypothetical protein